ncbi:MAG: 1-acyl-sn-glycerol-3-phosphate acyltransferase [Desulfovibrio sp.]|nr:1-acyl-sn-glycerol-3-phosphate acyltransferase [Desulfovibrio sp.]
MHQKFHCIPGYATSNVATPNAFVRLCPSLFFYSKVFLGPLRWLCKKARNGECDDACWVQGSVWFANLLEELGSPLIIEGLDTLEKAPKPFVIVANHMSTLETFLLPAIVRPFSPLTFVVKKSLTTMPFFGPLMRSRDPVVVQRTNPREDLVTVLTEGEKRLKQGISIIVFPQSTRSSTFIPQHFNTIGEKLAKRAQVPLIPLALKTDAWKTGKYIKEIGPFIAGLPIRFRFGQALSISGNGKSEHESICDFIAKSLAEWQTQPLSYDASC